MSHRLTRILVAPILTTLVAGCNVDWTDPSGTGPGADPVADAGGASDAGLPPPVDAGEVADAGNEAPDAGVPEVADAGNEAPDAGVPEVADAGDEAPDAGVPEVADAGNEAPDAGVPEVADAGDEAPDAGVPEAGDAGEEADAGSEESSDAGDAEPIDGGAPIDETIDPGTTGDCGESPFTRDALGVTRGHFRATHNEITDLETGTIWARHLKFGNALGAQWACSNLPIAYPARFDGSWVGPPSVATLQQLRDPDFAAFLGDPCFASGVFISSEPATWSFACAPQTPVECTLYVGMKTGDVGYTTDGIPFANVICARQ